MTSKQTKSCPEFLIIGIHSHQCSIQMNILVPHIDFSVQQCLMLVCVDLHDFYLTWLQSNT